VYYTGKSVNDLGNYEGCKSLNDAYFLLIDASKSLKLPTYVGLCLPNHCTKDMVHNFLTYQPDVNLTSLFQLGADLDGAIEFDLVLPEEYNEKVTSSMNAGGVVMIIIVVIILFLVIVGSGIDAF
jgi:hypothetical protein